MQCTSVRSERQYKLLQGLDDARPHCLSAVNVGRVSVEDHLGLESFDPVNVSGRSENLEKPDQVGPISIYAPGVRVELASVTDTVLGVEELSKRQPGIADGHRGHEDCRLHRLVEILLCHCAVFVIKM